jgi:hypothetical protein
VGWELLRRAWVDLGGDPSLPQLVSAHGDPGLRSRLPVGDLALGAVGAQVLAARELAAAETPMPPIELDARHVGIAFRSERFLQIDGVPAPSGFAPLSRFWPTSDGWVRLHANYRHHQRAVLNVLGENPPAAISRRSSAEVEDAVVAAGGVAAAVRTFRQWSEHPAGAAVAAQPLLSLHRVAPGPARAHDLRGLRVLDLTRVIAGPEATRALAAHGADVLRIDSPGLPEDLTTLLESSPGKRCTQLDFTSTWDRRRLEELLADADVFVHGYRPSALARFGLVGEVLAERFPGLVVVSLSAWGARGPWAARRGFDSIVQAATGIAAATANPDGTPGVLPAQALDHGAGHLLAASVMRALTSARQQGGTWHGHLSLAQLAHWLLTAPQHPDAGMPDDDVRSEPYCVDLPSSEGVLTIIRPIEAPPWRHGPQLVTPAHARWSSRA